MRRSHLFWFVSVVVLSTALVLLPKSASAADLGFTCVTSGDPKTGDIVTYQLKKDTLTITVTKRRGIGGVKLSRGKQPWPKKIVVELKKWGNLEAFAVSSGVHRFQTSLKEAPLIWGRDSIKEDNEHELKGHVEIAEKDSDIIATVPKETFDWNVDELQIGWIDAYRQ